MHSPLTVAFEVVRPWPRRDRSFDAKPGEARWQARYSHATWRRPWRGWRRFWTIAGRGYYWPNVSHQWHRSRGRWWQGETGLYHRECSSLVMLQRQRQSDEELIRGLVAEIRFRADESEHATVDRLTGPENLAWEFLLRYRLQRLLGYARDDDFQLVKGDPP
ncbi:hypothetical protein H0B56_12195 [Haloechinothrix sp. YIM 98757]|uniref:Uncharacterized protein n=1 Tax=Haloechinothrix aidingensis TaxID=2752311 RepID=A0A838AAP5_9PSEU|nr:hypothetical protein [Haloechinothrix aidingensis]MBA0126303.1 hypothetical protein [Haloechinothrix aidingensis]